jgi:hypothetical protein
MELHPIYVLIDELKSSEIERKKEAIKNIRTLAIVLGPEETRNSLLKDLTELIEDKEVLMELLKIELFQDLLHFVGGTKHVDSLFDLLYTLLTWEDEETREKAWTVVKGLADREHLKAMQEDAMELTLKLLNGEWWKSKASGIDIAMYLLKSNIREDNLNKLKEQIIKSSQDPIFHVRKAVATKLTEYGDPLPIINELISDISEAVRQDWVQSLLSFSTAPSTSIETLISSCLPLWQKSFDDSAWRIKKLWVENFDKLFKTITEKEEDGNW